jgi:orotidine-5'-phosphate decarboxylase
VKPQIAFYEQYGIGGILAFYDTIQMAKERELIVIVDAKRGDIASTAAAYANAFLGRVKLAGVPKPMFDVDCITVSPFLGRDTLEPFVDACDSYGKGIFILVKTSNPGSKDLQDLTDNKTNDLIYMRLAYLVNEIGKRVIGQSGYSSIGAVVGATFPSEAQTLRKVMPRAFFLVPGYGAQGGHAQDAALCFNGDGMGAIVNAARSITYGFKDRNISRAEYSREIVNRLLRMISEISSATGFPATIR